MPELPLTMPKMSMTMEEGTMVSWLKAVGDPVRSGEPICEVATDKVDMEVESPFDGTLARIVAQPDEVLPVGATIAFITTEADDLLGGLFDAPAAPEAVAPAAMATDASAPGVAAREGVVPAVPAARALAHREGIELAAVPPTGPWGTVRVADVEAAVPQPAPPEPVVVESLGDLLAARRRRTRAVVAKVMSESAMVPQFTAFVDLDLSVLEPLRKSVLGGASWTALLLRAQSRALAEHPHVNASWVDGDVEHHEHVGIALAVDSPTGLLAPVLVDPHVTPLAELVAEIAELVELARGGTLPLARLSGGTSVFSNLGGFGVHSFNALLTPPQATALSAGAVARTLVVRDDGAFGSRLTCRVGLTVDHRVADGADAARVLATIADIVRDPAAVA